MKWDLTNTKYMHVKCPCVPPIVPGRGIVGQYIDRCIMIISVTSAVMTSVTRTSSNNPGRQPGHTTLHTCFSPYPGAVSQSTSNSDTQQLQLLRVLDGRVRRIEEQTSSVKDSVEEVKRLLDKHLQGTFQIKGAFMRYIN